MMEEARKANLENKQSEQASAEDVHMQPLADTAADLNGDQEDEGGDEQAPDEGEEEDGGAEDDEILDADWD